MDVRETSPLVAKIEVTALLLVSIKFNTLRKVNEFGVLLSFGHFWISSVTRKGNDLSIGRGETHSIRLCISLILKRIKEGNDDIAVRFSVLPLLLLPLVLILSSSCW